MTFSHPYQLESLLPRLGYCTVKWMKSQFQGFLLRQALFNECYNKSSLQLILCVCKKLDLVQMSIPWNVKLISVVSYLDLQSTSEVALLLSRAE